MENLNDDKDINRAWENIKEIVKTSAKERVGLQELKQHKPWLWRMFRFITSKEAG